jgi:hypothetical protein
MSASGVGLWAVILALAVGCGGSQETIIRTADGVDLTAEDIDREPMALLPGGMIGLGYVDAQKLFASQFGDRLLNLVQRLAPLPASTGFDPRRDLQRLYVGLYSMQGIDVAGVAVGTFDQQAIERAAERSDRTLQGVPVVKSTYADRTLYTAHNLGFVVLTAKTALFGNETGIRRALDRIDEARVQKQVPAWAADLLENPNASMVAALNLRAQPLTEAVQKKLPFLMGMQSARILGNFQPPGVNFAGTAEYEDAAAAQRGEAAMRDYHATLQTIGYFSAWVGLPQPVKRLETRNEGDEVKFVVGVDAQAMGTLLDFAANALPAPVAPAGG